MFKHLLSFLSIVFIGIFYLHLQPPGEVLGESIEAPEIIPVEQPIRTESRFGFKYETTTDIIPRQVITRDNPDREYGDDTTIQEGSDGKRTKTIKITFFEGEEFSREITRTEVIDSVDKIIDHGTKIVWHTLNTPDGEIQYWRKMRVYATHYDSHCPGCDEWTAIGMRAGYGVIAVDPRVIKLRSQVYVPGYGKAVAGDTGGAIKGNIIDLGFEDAHTAGWHAQYVDIYLLDKAPN